MHDAYLAVDFFFGLSGFVKYFDEPVRAWLTRRYGIKRSSSINPVTA
jgi:hypothetical protein